MSLKNYKMNFKFNNISLYLVLFLYGLFIPQISSLVLLIYASYQFFLNVNKIFKIYLLQIVLLAFFIASHYTIAYLYGFLDSIYPIVQNLLVFIAVYIVGASIDLNKNNLVNIIIVLIIGIMTFSFSSVYITYFTGNFEMALMQRGVTSIWSGVFTNSPVVGAFTLLSLSLIPLLFIRTLEIKMKLLILILLGLSLVILFLFQSRGPFLSAAIILITSYIYLYRSFQIVLFKTKYFFLIAIVLILVIIMFSHNIFLNETLDAYQNRMERMGVESDRYRTWLIGLKGMFLFPFGGRAYQIGGVHFLHNMYLDLDYISGILPLVFLLLFFISHLDDIKILSRNKINVNEKLILFIFGFSTFLPTIFEPIMQASPTFFTFHVFFLALLRNYNMTEISSTINKKG